MSDIDVLRCLRTAVVQRDASYAGSVIRGWYIGCYTDVLYMTHAGQWVCGAHSPACWWETKAAAESALANARKDAGVHTEADMLATIAALTQRAEAAEAKYRFMVERAADEKLGGYRELGARAANAENRADALAARLKAAEACVRRILRECDPDGVRARFDHARAAVRFDHFGEVTICGKERNMTENEVKQVPCISLLDIVADVSKTMRCNCDLDNWEPERDTGHSWVCRIHKAAKARMSNKVVCENDK